jgi:nucleoside-diphosphate-sugar epimerase
VLILGPILYPNIGASLSRLVNLINGTLKVVPNMYFPMCDVRDVALAHLKAAFSNEAIGHRHIIISSRKTIPMRKWAEIMRKEFSSKDIQIPNEIEDGEGKGYKSTFSDSRMRNVLGITPHEIDSTIIDTVNSLIEFGLVKPQ